MDPYSDLIASRLLAIPPDDRADFYLQLACSEKESTAALGRAILTDHIGYLAVDNFVGALDRRREAEASWIQADQEFEAMRRLTATTLRRTLRGND